MKTLIFGIATGILLFITQIQAQGVFNIIGGGNEAFDVLAEVPGLVAWYKGSLGVTLDGDTVEVWADQSGSNNNLTKTFEAVQGWFKMDVINNKPSLKWQTASPELKLASGLNLNTYTVFIISQRGSDLSAGYLTYSTSGVGYSRYDVTNTMLVDVSTPLETANGTCLVGETHLTQVSSNATTITVYVKGASVDTTITSTDGLNWTFLSLGVATAGRANNEVAEIIISNQNLSDAVKLAVRNYLISEYAVP